MKTIAISNYKGGVGKTTTALNLACVFASQGQRVLLIDLDPQANITDYFGLYERAADEGRSTIELLYSEAPIADVAFCTPNERLSVVPSLFNLGVQNESLLTEQTLRFALLDASDDYDICIIDCSLDMRGTSFNAYAACTDGGLIILPVVLDASVLRGTLYAFEAAEGVGRALRLPAPKCRVLQTCIPGKNTINKACGTEVFGTLFSERMFETTIHSCTKVGEGSWGWSPVVEHAPKSRTARDYFALAKEVLHELG